MNFSRQIAVPALLTVFGTVSILGTGLHLISGCNHTHSPMHCNGAHRHVCHHPLGAKQQPVTEIGDSHEDCAICRFLALPRALTPPTAIIACGLPFKSIVPVAAEAPERAPARPYAARAPPRLPLNA
jgi:hypothetical protein